GSGSHTVQSPLLAELGEIHYGRKRQQPPGRTIKEFYDEARVRLKHLQIQFDLDQITLIGEAFHEVMRRQRYTCYACAIMPDHVHVLIRKHRHWAEEMIEKLQEASRDYLVERGAVAMEHPVWTMGGWQRFLEHPDDIERVIRYIRENPPYEGMDEQHWDFVTP